MVIVIALRKVRCLCFVLVDDGHQGRPTSSPGAMESEMCCRPTTSLIRSMHPLMHDLNHSSGHAVLENGGQAESRNGRQDSPVGA